MSISSKLTEWYRLNHRDLPWRHTSDPYKIWVSEIILQQTRVNQGMPYYQRFIEEFPTISHLANASSDKVMKLWQGLGYYSRARHLHTAAKLINLEHKKKFPSDYHKIRQLPGIGDYTAAAIASIAFGLPYAVLDGNVARVISRLFAITLPINSAKGKKELQSLADSLLNKRHPGLHNQAIMELGALICTPQKPVCDRCPISQHCFAFIKRTVDKFPVKEKRGTVSKRYFNYIYIRYRDSIYMKQRGAGDIWQNLFDFPLIETSNPETPEKLIGMRDWKQWFKGIPVQIVSVTDRKVHKLSHQHIYPRIIEVNPKRAPVKLKDMGYVRIPLHRISGYAVPRIIENVLREKLESYAE